MPRHDKWRGDRPSASRGLFPPPLLLVLSLLLLCCGSEDGPLPPESARTTAGAADASAGRETGEGGASGSERSTLPRGADHSEVAGDTTETGTHVSDATRSDAAEVSQADASGSTDDEPLRIGALTGLEDWRVLGPEEDPWVAWRPDVLECTEAQAAPLIEEGLIEFDLKRCPWFSVEHPLLQDVREGETLRVLASHAVLQSLEPSTGHMELRIGDDIIFSYEVPIPHPSAILHELPPSPADYAAGTPVRVHVRNHGPNSWRLHLLEVIP